MSMNGTSERDASAVVSPVAPSLEQVRELLFGAHFRELERKLGRVDAHLGAEAEEIRKEMRRRLEVLEAHVQRESEALVVRFESERSAHVESLASNSRESRDMIAVLEQRVAKMEEALARAQRDLRQQILDQTKSFLDETRRARDELVSTFERELAAADGEGHKRLGSGEVREQASGY